MLEVITPAATHDLTVLDTVKEELGLAPEDTSKDGRLRRLIGEASTIVASYCKREGFGKTLYRETFDHRRGTSWRTRGVMLTEDLNVKVVAVQVGADLLDASGYVYDGVLLRRVIAGDSTILLGSYGWNCRMMLVTYWAGWDAMAEVPRDVERAVLDVVISLYTTTSPRDRSIRSEEVAGVGTITYGTQAAGSALLSPERYPGLDQYMKQTLF